MTRGDRVRVNFDNLPWPICVTHPHGRTGKVLEMMGALALLQLDGGDNVWVNVIHLEKITDDRSHAIPD